MSTQPFKLGIQQPNGMLIALSWFIAQLDQHTLPFFTNCWEKW